MSDGMTEAARAQREWEKENGVYWENPAAHSYGYNLVKTLVELRRYAVKAGGSTMVLPKSGYVAVIFDRRTELWAPAERPEGVSKRTVQRFKLVSRD